VGIRWGLLPIALWVFADNGMAQSVPDNISRDAQRIQDRETQRQNEREENFRNSQVTPPSGEVLITPEAATEQSDACIEIRKVAVQNMTRYKESEFANSLSKLVSSCTSIGQINMVLRDITNRYVSDGFVTSRALIGPQDLKDGTLKIIVVEGQVSGIKSPGDGYGQGELATAFAGHHKGQLNLRAIEQGIDQLSRLPSYEPGIDIEPADLPGASTLIVKRQRAGQSIRPSLSFDNDGSASTGRIQSTVSVDADSVLGLADFWSLYYSRDLKSGPNQGSEGLGGFVSLPMGWWTISASGGRFTYESVLTGDQQSFSNDGLSWNASLTVDRMIFRNARTKFSLSAAMALLDTENRIQGIRLSSSSYRQATGSIGFRLQHKLKDALLGLDLGLTRGLKILGANAANTGPGGATIKARRLTAAFTYQTKGEVIGVPLDYSLLLRGQAALDPVFSSGRFSLGGSSTVRGFRDDGISGRYGIFLRQQIGFPIMTVFEKSKTFKTSIAGFLGYDAGAIFAHNNDRFERGQLHGSTFGLRIGNARIQSEVSASVPVQSPDFVKRKQAEFSASVRLLF
jgi:hemolysin activation/secretion protein